MFCSKKNNDPSNDPDLAVAKEVTQYCDKVYTLYNGMPESDFLANFTNLSGWMDYDRHPISQYSKKNAFYFSYHSLTRTRNGITAPLIHIVPRGMRHIFCVDDYQLLY